MYYIDYALKKANGKRNRIPCDNIINNIISINLEFNFHRFDYLRGEEEKKA